MRSLAVWAVLFAAYAATLAVDAAGSDDYAGAEPRYLLAAESIVSDWDLDLTDEFRTRAYAPFHHGDIGNIEVGADGRAQLTLSSKMWTIGGPPETNVLGHAIVVHAKADDFTTQPSGNAGGRVACGVIQKLQ